ncbi:MAG: redoxin domain-containing protein [Armatimonadota bacterium]|nr:redoxin domain-containing protein [bacterium]
MESIGHEISPGKLIPYFSLESTDGKMISTWDFKEKMGLVIVFFNPRSSADLEAIAQINSRYQEITDENAEVLAVGSGAVEEMTGCVAGMNFRFPLLMDSNGEAARSFNVEQGAIFAADRYGELRMKAALADDLDSTLDNAINAISLSELECPECGVSSWPAE